RPANLLPWLLLAGDYFSGRITFGQFNQAAIAFGTLKGAISIIVDQFASIASYTTVVNRLADFYDGCESIAQRAPSAIDAGRITLEESEGLALQKLTLTTPDHRRTLIRDLSFKLDHGQRLLMHGPSGTGKTSLLRAIAGLWTAGLGHIVRPAFDEAMF